MHERVEEPMATTGYIKLDTYRRTLTDRKWFIFLFVAASIAATLISGKLAASNYEAGATLVLSKSAAEVLGSSMAVNQIISGDGLLNVVVSKGKLAYSIAQVRDKIRADSVSGTRLVKVTAADPQAGRAKQMVDLAAAQFIVEANRADTNLNNLRAQIEQVNDQLRWIDKLLKSVQAASTDMQERNSELISQSLPQAEKAVYLFGNNQRLSGLESREQSLIEGRFDSVNRKRDLQTQLAQLGHTRVVSPAVRPTARSAPDLRLRLLFSTVAAFLASIGLAIAFRPRETEAL